MIQQDQLVNTWHSATDRPNILVIGTGDQVYVSSALALRTSDPPCEVVCLDKFSDALRLLRRGSIALVVIGESPATEGGLELILEGLGKTRPPRYVIAVSGAPKPSLDSSPLVRCAMNGPASMRDAMLMALADYERGITGNLRVRTLLEATAGFPEQIWLKVCNEEGEFSDLCLNAGRIVYAECGRLSGPAAVEKVLGWSNCLYETRELPSFLQSNMSCWLRELGRLHQPELPPPPVEQPVPVEEIPECEEPTELVTLAGVPDLTSAVADPAVIGDTPAPITVDETPFAPEEPVEPSFDFSSGEEIDVEEPLDMVLEPDEELQPIAEPEEPDLFDMPAPAATVPEQMPEERIFSAIAIIAEGTSHLENCSPESEAIFFDTLAIRDIFDLAIRCAQRQQTGAPKWIEVTSEAGCLVIAPIPGSGRLVAVRLPGTFGERERFELERLQQRLQQSCSLV